VMMFSFELTARGDLDEYRAALEQAKSYRETKGASHGNCEQ